MVEKRTLRIGSTTKGSKGYVIAVVGKDILAEKLTTSNIDDIARTMKEVERLAKKKAIEKGYIIGNTIWIKGDYNVRK